MDRQNERNNEGKTRIDQDFTGELNLAPRNGDMWVDER